MSTHTPGWNGEQWKVEHEADGNTDVVFEVQNAELQYLVASLYGAPADRLRHARLVASAPELLEALDALLRDEPLDDDDPRLNASREKARAAIARATGGK